MIKKWRKREGKVEEERQKIADNWASIKGIWSRAKSTSRSSTHQKVGFDSIKGNPIKLNPALLRLPSSTTSQPMDCAACSDSLLLLLFFFPPLFVVEHVIWLSRDVSNYVFQSLNPTYYHHSNYITVSINKYSNQYYYFSNQFK